VTAFMTASGAWHAPRSATLGFTAWMVFWVAVILWAYGPQNFLWICNLAQCLVLYALWRGDRLVLSSQAGTVCMVGLVWTLDFSQALVTGGSSATFTAYMFNPELPLLARATSLYHVGLPIFVLWLLHRSGYDRRGPWLQCLVGAVAVTGGWLLTEPHRNVNWVHAPFGVEQVWLPTSLFVALLLVLYPLLLYLPGHYLVRFMLRRFNRSKPDQNLAERRR
jgi:hypothetical protein